MNTRQSIDLFLQQSPIGFVGISRDEKKFGNSAYRELKKRGLVLLPVHPEMQHFDNDTCARDVDQLPASAKALFVSTKPEKTIQLVEKAIQHGIEHFWLQQGSTDAAVIQLLNEKNVDAVYGRCILMFAEPVTSVHHFHRFFVKMFGKYPKNQH